MYENGFELALDEVEGDEKAEEGLYGCRRRYGIGTIVGGNKWNIGKGVEFAVNVDVRAKEKEDEGVEDKRAKVFDHEDSAPANLGT